MNRRKTGEKYESRIYSGRFAQLHREMCIRDRRYPVQWKLLPSGCTGDYSCTEQRGRAGSPADRGYRAVSYTHLDVYKRQILYRVNGLNIGKDIIALRRSGFCITHLKGLYAKICNTQHRGDHMPDVYKRQVRS